MSLLRSELYVCKLLITNGALFNSFSILHTYVHTDSYLPTYLPFIHVYDRIAVNIKFGGRFPAAASHLDSDMFETHSWSQSVRSPAVQK